MSQKVTGVEVMKGASGTTKNKRGKQTRQDITQSTSDCNAVIANAVHELLEAADLCALDNVASGRGGPFGALLAVLDLETGKCVRMAAPSGNAVLFKGESSAHAENEALQPKNIRKLVEHLTQWKAEDRDYRVILASTGQSCPSCHAIEEIVSRHLISLELIAAEDFIVGYGATFEDAYDIAGFNDEQYVQDLVRSYQRPYSRVSMVRHHHIDIRDIPPSVADLFMDSAAQIAVVARGDEILAVGSDLRSSYDVISTAETSAIRSACRVQYDEGVDQPWMLGDVNYVDPDPRKAAVLYTKSDIGPLMRGAAQWVAVGEIVSVKSTEWDSIVTEVNEPGVTNRMLFDAIARGYNYPGAVLRVVHDPLFANQAQRAWGAMLEDRDPNAILYNGFGVDPDLLNFADMVKTAFRGEVLDTEAVRQASRPCASTPGAVDDTHSLLLGMSYQPN